MSTLKEFLFELSEELRFLPAKQVNEILKHYRDKVNTEVDYGNEEEKVIASMKSPQEIAKGIYEMHGINYLAKRKKVTKFKNSFNGIVFSFALLASLMVFVVSSIFIITVLINMLSLIGHIFKFPSVVDIIVSSIFTISYFLIMFGLYIYIIDLFIILINSLMGKIFDCMDKTRGKTYKFMDFTINGWLNKLTKKSNILLKTMGGCLCIFVFFGITSYVTKSYVYRSINNQNTHVNDYTLTEQFNDVEIVSNNAYVIVTTDSQIEIPQIKFEYEFSSMDYKISDNKLYIKVDETKTYDFLGLLKTPLPIMHLIIPSNYNVSNLNVNLNYGKLVLDKFQSISGDINIKTISADLRLNESVLPGKVAISCDTSQVITKGNNIFDLELNQLSGSLSLNEDSINTFEHKNGSSNVKIVGTNIINYTLTNNSGSIYLERVKGEKIVFTTNASINETYDLYFKNGEFKVQNTSSLTLTRSVFDESVVINSSNSSYQTISYISSPQITMNGNSGQIICEYVNCLYDDSKIKKFDNDYQKYLIEFNEKVKNSSFQTNLNIKSIKTNVSLNEIIAKSLDLSINSASTAILNLNIETSIINFKDTGAKINNYYGKKMTMKMESSKFTSSTNVEYYNDKKSDLVIELTGDGMSQFLGNEFITIGEGNG